MDDEFCKERARTVRALAEQAADPIIKKRLLQLAAHYERRIQLLEKETPKPKRSISERQN